MMCDVASYELWLYAADSELDTELGGLCGYVLELTFWTPRPPPLFKKRKSTFCYIFKLNKQ